MSWTNWGFDGTINEAQWSQMAGLLGNGYVAAGNGDCLATAVGGSRAVSVAAGTLYGDGVVSVNSGAETVAMTTPVNGQWYVIVLTRTWATNSVALRAVAGATTSTTTPTAPPTSFPTLNTNVGVLTDQPIAWAWCNSANTTVVVYDIRLKAVKSLPPVVATAAERDAKFMTPTQGLQVWRDDLGAVETYFGLYNASTNPGGRDAAGWYADTRVAGLVPIRPASVVVATGTATVNALGAITFTGATSISLNNIFSSSYENYKIIFTNTGATANHATYVRMRKSGTDSATSYRYGGLAADWNGSLSGASSGTGSTTQFYPIAGTSQGYDTGFTAEVFAPMVSGRTRFSWIGNADNGSTIWGATGSGYHNVVDTYDGITFLPSAGTISGIITVYGYNH